MDASVVVAALLDTGPEGAWAEEILTRDHLAAPHLLPVEVANILRRAALAGDVSLDVATLAHADLVELPVELFPYQPFSDRVWALHQTVTAYDAWYVAIAEALEADLVTLDGRLARAAGVRCRVVTPSIP